MELLKLLVIFCCGAFNSAHVIADNTDNYSTLEDEMDNQENVLTQVKYIYMISLRFIYRKLQHEKIMAMHFFIIALKLLGDYDKVKTFSEGSDCRCKCVVRPLSRSACKRIEDGNAKTEDFYTVETVTGANCKKCACIAPPSALNPCEGDFRFKKLQEAGKDDVKVKALWCHIAHISFLIAKLTILLI